RAHLVEARVSRGGHLIRTHAGAHRIAAGGASIEGKTDVEAHDHSLLEIAPVARDGRVGGGGEAGVGASGGLVRLGGGQGGDGDGALAHRQRFDGRFGTAHAQIEWLGGGDGRNHAKKRERNRYSARAHLSLRWQSE